MSLATKFPLDCLFALKDWTGGLNYRYLGNLISMQFLSQHFQFIHEYKLNPLLTNMKTNELIWARFFINNKTNNRELQQL